ncbi:MAG: VCBS repeat-containing protein [Gammaproteobacteria bacterium]|nr:VCBS repeat-containing protein [Gammaproteobacteria bacterium]
MFSYKFADMDGSDERELVLIETGSKDSFAYTVSINRIQENDQRQILYVTERQSSNFKLLIGDIDGDKKDEVILHRTADSLEEQTSETVRVIEFDDQKFKEWGTSSMNGERGAVLDIDDDGKQEILMVAFTNTFIEESEGLDDTEMRIYSLQGNKFNLLNSFDTSGRSIRCVTTGDVDWDGKMEIVTQEASRDGEILHQISIYDVDNTGTITHSYSKNEALTFSLFPTRARAMRTFVDRDSNSYISVYKASVRRLDDMVLRVENGVADLVEIRGDMRLQSTALSERLPYSGKFYAEIIDREPKLWLYTYEELGQAVR